MKIKKIFKKLLSITLAFILLLSRPLYGVGVLAEGENTQTGTDSSNQATAGAGQTTSIQNENTAVVENNVEVIANSGENSVTSEPMAGIPNEESSPTPIPDQDDLDSKQAEESTPTPTSEEVTPTPSENLTPTPTLTQEISEQISLSPTPQLGPVQGSTESGVIAENQGTGENSQNSASASVEESTTIINNNQTEIENTATVSSETGSNQTEGNLVKIETGEATGEANLVNIVNTNLVGENFWHAIINVLGTAENDVDLTQIEGIQNFDPNLVSVLAKNEKTGDGSINIALANFLSAFSVWNVNNATLTNDVALLSSTGGNQIQGEDGEILTGNANAYLNLFNLVNTNLVGKNWFFGNINIFGDLNGDIILPYELQFLGEDENGDSQVLAQNQNTGEGSQNQAQASGENTVEITNTNDATLTNNISVLANSGENAIIGGGSIQTGEVQASANLVNIINTNITSSRWLLLWINNFGNWTGKLINWWGNLISANGYTLAWIKLPDVQDSDNTSSVSAGNFNTGENSSNQANASVINTLEVNNNNTAKVENNITVVADTGNNQIQGEDSLIKTGDAKSSANVINMVNTNIVGNNWFFGIVNIFDNFFGNIIFPRPDLSITKTADKETVRPGEEITYSISSRNQGRLWAKETLITDTLPSGVAFISASPGGVYQDGKVIWNLGKVWPFTGKDLNLIVKVNDDVSDGTLLKNCVSISTVTDEPNKENNYFCYQVIVRKGPPLPTPTPTVFPSPSPSPTPTEALGVGGPSAGGGGVGGQPGSVGPCIPPAAPSAPTLLSAITVSSTEVKLTWTPVDQASYYLVAYGLESRNYIYGSPNVGNVTSYTVGSLTPGLSYYFVVAAVADGGCPASGPYSNELSNTFPAGGVFTPTEFPGKGILGVKAAEGELGEASATQQGEASGAKDEKSVCPWWLILSLGNIVFLGGYFWLLNHKKGARNQKKFWWIIPLATAILAYLGDHYLAHKYFTPSRYCDLMSLWCLLSSGIPTSLYLGFRKSS